MLFSKGNLKFKFLSSYHNYVMKNSKSSFTLNYKSHGDPLNVLEKIDTTKEVLNKELNFNEVLVEFKASIINPADINTIQGVYGILPKLPFIPGGEGCAQVIKKGSLVKNINIGDKVIPTAKTFGTWRTHAVAKEEDFRVLNPKLTYYQGSQLVVNPCTAYRMLKDFYPLKPGDTLIQNGANSAVGKNVIQFSKKWNFITVNVIRNREKIELEQLIDELKNLGADFIVFEEDLKNREKMENIWKKILKPKLLLNCVGGKNLTDCIRHLDENGVIVTYGGMSKQPIIIPTGQTIFKDLTSKGFWMTRWLEKNKSNNENKEMMNYITDSFINGDLNITKPIKFKLDDYKEAIKVSMEGNVKGKVTFVSDDLI